jgi:VanZ family protein
LSEPRVPRIARSRIIARWIPAILWAALLLWLGHRDPGDLPSGPEGSDKLLHAGAYGVLGVFAGWAALRRPRDGRNLARGALVGLIATLLIGCLDEWGQSTVEGRYAGWGDIVADVVGGTCGGWLIARLSAYNA